MFTSLKDMLSYYALRTNAESRVREQLLFNIKAGIKPYWSEACTDQLMDLEGFLSSKYDQRMVDNNIIIEILWEEM